MYFIIFFLPSKMFDLLWVDSLALYHDHEDKSHTHTYTYTDVMKIPPVFPYLPPPFLIRSHPACCSFRLLLMPSYYTPYQT